MTKNAASALDLEIERRGRTSTPLASFLSLCCCYSSSSSCRK